jgi:hypothetical protein
MPGELNEVLLVFALDHHLMWLYREEQKHIVYLAKGTFPRYTAMGRPLNQGSP